MYICVHDTRPINTFVQTRLGHNHKTIDTGFQQANFKLATPTLVSDQLVLVIGLCRARRFTVAAAQRLPSPGLALYASLDCSNGDYHKLIIIFIVFSFQCIMCSSRTSAADQPFNRS